MKSRCTLLRFLFQELKEISLYHIFLRQKLDADERMSQDSTSCQYGKDNYHVEILGP